MKKNIKEEVKRAAIYCRVSTEEQAKGDFTSLDSQKKILNNYAESMQIEVFKIYQDTASGKDLNRSGFKKMLADAEEGKFEKILITRVDRISRNIRDFLNLTDKLDSLQIHLISQSELIDTSTPMGRVVRNLLVMFGQMEREMSNERTSEKMVSMIKEGLWTGGLTPLGYDLIQKKLIINDTEAKLVNYIFNYYLEQPSALKVAQKLNSLGHKSKIRITRDGKSSGGGNYNKSAIIQILRNEVYIGKRRYKENLYEGKHSPIVSENLFDKVQRRLDLSKIERHTTKESELPHTLNELIECGFCGRLMTSSYANPRGKKYYTYRCTSRNRDTKERCVAKDIKLEDLEGFVQKVLKQLIQDSKYFDSVFQRLLFNASKGLKENQEKLSELNTNLIIKKGECTNILNAIAQINSDRARKPLLEKLEELNFIQEGIESQILSLKEKIQIQNKQSISKNDLKTVFQRYIDNYSSISKEKKKKLNHLLFNKIVVKVDSNTGEGDVTIKIRADGELNKKWKDLQEDFNLSNFRKVWYPGEDSNLRPTV